jgi:lambda family phage portal protein
MATATVHILDSRGNPIRSQKAAIVAKFDSAQTTAENRNHWANADLLSADAAASPSIRQALRSRARYEVANNSYARGIVLTLANDTIGTGPRLQMATGIETSDRLIEQEFGAWMDEVRLPELLRTMRMARAQDGEAFALFSTNRQLRHPVKLSITLVEADQITTPDLSYLKEDAVDGIIFDWQGNPVTYHMLRVHPGSSMGYSPTSYRQIQARYMIHWFRVDRPGQSRGLPDILPALPLFAQLRRYTLAVIGAAETAADIAVIMHTNAPAGGEAAEVTPMNEIEFQQRMGVFVPEGWQPSQLKAEQPATTYEMFKHEILNEIARCLNMPYNVAAGNSSSYNYASGRLDHQTYYKSIAVDQRHCEAVVLDRILAAWLEEASLLYGFETIGAPLHQWFWDGHEHVDPQKEANAQATRLVSNTTTLAAEYAKQGLDWEEQLRQRARELELMKKLGLPAPGDPVTVAVTNPNSEPPEDTDGE